MLTIFWHNNTLKGDVCNKFHLIKISLTTLKYNLCVVIWWALIGLTTDLKSNFSTCFLQTVLIQLPWFWNNIKHKNILNCVTVFHFGHILSLASTSFIEEEHQTVYFSSITLLLLILFQVSRVEMNKRSDFKSNPPSNNFRSLIFKGLLLMGFQKIARCWNQTGDKWGHLVIFNFVCLPLKVFFNNYTQA